MNVNMERYQLQPSQLNAGGVAIYMNEKLDHFKRNDLSKYDEKFEAVSVEMKMTKTFSVVVCIDTLILIIIYLSFLN